jgi:LysR family glycine cleavage system transcriptional activator
VSNFSKEFITMIEKDSHVGVLPKVLRLPPLPALRAFAAVARLGNVSLAADELNVTYGAISHQIRALEEHLQAVLVVRAGRKITLTDAGRIYAYQIRQALEEMLAATERVVTQLQSQQLVLSILPSFALYWLMPRLADFVAHHPGLRLSLSASMSFIDFDEDPADCAIRFGHGQWANLRCEHLMGDSLLLVAAPTFKPMDVVTALSQPLLHASESWSLWLSAAGHETSSPAAAIEFTDSSHMLDAARRGLGVALTRRSIAQSLIDSGDLQQVTDIEVVHPSSYFLVWPRRSHQNKNLLSLKKWLISHMKTV